MLKSGSATKRERSRLEEKAKKDRQQQVTRITITPRKRKSGIERNDLARLEKKENEATANRKNLGDSDAGENMRERKGNVGNLSFFLPQMAS